MKRYFLVPVILVIANLLSCTQGPTNPEPEPGIAVLLESESVNAGWGYYHAGWFVDSAGNVYTYSLSNSRTRWVPSPSGYYTAHELWVKFHDHDTLTGRISPDTLAMLRRLALGSVAGQSSDTVQRGADMGSTTYWSYIYQADSSEIRQTMLRVSGDFECYNTSEEAIELSDWMSRR